MSISLTGRESDLEEFKKINEELGEQENLLNDLEFNLFFISTHYLLYQSYVFTLTFSSHPSLLRCPNRWIPFYISLFSTLINGFAIARTALKYTHTKRHLNINRLKQDGWKIYGHDAANVPGIQNCLLKPNLYKWVWQYAFMEAFMMVLFDVTNRLLITPRRPFSLLSPPTLVI